MEYPEIVSMIDADLELLKKVRQLLAPSSPPPGTRKTVKPNRKRATQIELELSGFATAVAETASAPETLEPKSRDDAQTETSVEGRTPVTTVIRSRPPKRQNDRAVETTALKGSVPMGPVFVPAQAGSAKNRPSAGTQSKVAVMPPALTAEALARQWLSRENA